MKHRNMLLESIDLLELYLAQQWWKSVNGDNGPILFLKILNILKQVDYKYVLNLIKKYKNLETAKKAFVQKKFSLNKGKFIKVKKTF